MITSLRLSFSPYANSWKAFSLVLGIGVLMLTVFTLQFGYEEGFLFLHKSWGGFWDSVMPHLTHLADGAMAGGIFGLLYARKKTPMVIGVLFSLVMVAITVAFLKQGIFEDWHRPASVFGLERIQLLSLGKETRFSFPSGHSAAAACLGWFIATARTSPGWGTLVGLTTVFLGFTRIYIGVHFPGDVAAGLAVGFVIALIGTFLGNKAELYLMDQSHIFQKRVQHALSGLALTFLLFGIANTIVKYYLP